MPGPIWWPCYLLRVQLKNTFAKMWRPPIWCLLYFDAGGAWRQKDDLCLRHFTLTLQTKRSVTTCSGTGSTSDDKWCLESQMLFAVPELDANAKNECGKVYKHDTFRYN